MITGEYLRFMLFGIRLIYVCIWEFASG